MGASAAPQILRWGSMHWKLGGGQYYSKNPEMCKSWGCRTSQLLWWHHPCMGGFVYLGDHACAGSFILVFMGPWTPWTPCFWCPCIWVIHGWTNVFGWSVSGSMYLAGSWVGPCISVSIWVAHGSLYLCCLWVDPYIYIFAPIWHVIAKSNTPCIGGLIRLRAM